MSHADIRAAVIEAVARVRKESQVTPLADDEAFALLGLDSLERMSMLVEVENILGLTLNDLDPKKLNCIKDYITALEGMTQARKAA